MLFQTIKMLLFNFKIYIKHFIKNNNNLKKKIKQIEIILQNFLMMNLSMKI